LKREIGTAGITATIVGYVIGASIFILPGQLAGSAGPAVVLSYLFAAVIAAFASVAAAQLGSVFPKTGAGYVAISKLVSPLGGFLIIWLMLAAYVFAIALIANGFSDYFAALFPGVNKTYAAYGVVLFFGVINLGGLKSLATIQGLLVLMFMVALAAVSFGGIVSIDMDNLTPFIPGGMSPVILAVVPAFFSYGGFMVVLELAGEVRDPSRSIPRGLAISFLVVLVTYACLSLALVGAFDWKLLATMDAPVTHLADKLFGSNGALFVTLAAVGAAATSVNALVLVASRDIIALGEAGIFSRVLVGNGDGRQSAAPSVVLVTLLAIGSLMLGQSVTEYAIWVSVITLIYQVIVGQALLRVRHGAKEAYEASKFRIGRTGLMVCGVGLMVISIGFTILIFMENSARALGALVYLAAGILYYLYAKRQQERKQDV